MGACNSVSAKKEVLSENEATLMHCKQTREKLSKYIKDLETRENNAREKAKNLLRSKQRDRAKLYLKQCKIYKDKAKIAEGKLDMIDEQIINIENAKTAKDTLNALNQGKEALHNLQNDVKIEELDKIKEDFEDLK